MGPNVDPLDQSGILNQVDETFGNLIFKIKRSPLGNLPNSAFVLVAKTSNNSYSSQIVKHRHRSMNNIPGTAGGPGGRDRTLAVKSRKTAGNQFFP